MKQLGSAGDYKNGTYTIEGTDRKRRSVPQCTREGNIRLTGEEPHVYQLHPDPVLPVTSTSLQEMGVKDNKFSVDNRFSVEKTRPAIRKKNMMTWLEEYTNRVLERTMAQVHLYMSSGDIEGQ